MATVDQTVETAIRCFPSLFDSRTAVLHHILCIIGNGYSWSNGEAVDEYPGDSVAWTREKFDASHQEFFGRTAEGLSGLSDTQEVLDRIQATHEERMISYASISADAVRLAQVRVELEPKFGGPAIYPQDDYALLMNVPEDITPDWAEAVAEMRAYATAHGWVFETTSA